MSLRSFRLLAVASAILVASLSAQAENYCMALRGNGELMPAHWGAMAQTIENFGLPVAIAGGSSASISSFLLESVVLNPVVQSGQGSTQALNASFLVKSMQGYSYAMAADPQWKALLDFTQMIGNQNVLAGDNSVQKLIQILARVQSQLTAQDLSELAIAFNDIKNTQVFAGPAVVKLLSAVQTAQKNASAASLANVQVQMAQVRSSLAVFGKFDAKNDRALFLRDGVVNFNAMAHLFGRMAAFYAMKDAKATLQANFRNYVQACAAHTEGKSWNQIIAQKPQCQNDLATLIKNYFSTDGLTSSRIQDPIGTGLHTLLTTSVVVGDSRATLITQKKQFDQTHDLSLGDNVNVNPQDIRFGYWGAPADLQQVALVLTNPNIPQLPKSKKFLSLGPATWEVVLSNSPAEPGLSTFNLFATNKGDQFLSLGGWSDLHPVPVLKALGCEKVIYLTRKGGDSLFGEGVAKRLFKLDDSSIPWSALDSSVASQILNDAGKPSDQTSPWSLMYNLANPNSSYAASIAQADAVVCTNWNSFDIKKDFTSMIEDSYFSPVYMPRPIASTGLHLPSLITAEANVKNAQGVPAYSGCIPLQ